MAAPAPLGHCYLEIAIDAEYLTVLPPKELLQAKLQEAIAIAHRRLSSSSDETC
jgi:hypothetical protein